METKQTTTKKQKFVLAVYNGASPLDISMKAYDTLEEAQKAMRDVFEYDVEKALKEDKVDGEWGEDGLYCGVLGSEHDEYYDDDYYDDDFEDEESEDFYNEYDLCCQILPVDIE